MEHRARLGGRLALSVLALLAVMSCTRPAPPPPPVTSVGDPIVGPNPQTPGTPGATTTTVRYGPWTVPAATGTGHDQSGMVEDVKVNAPKPCTDCYITAARPQLRFRDGRVANTDTGLWLHHFVLFNSGGVDARCGGTLAQLLGEVLFTGANERTGGRFPPYAGYRVRPLDRWSLLVDLMNTGTAAQDVVFEMTYDWVPASTPGMHHGRPVFLDVGQACVNSTFPSQPGAFSRKNTWTVTVPGRVLGLASHMHDGGTHLVVRNLTTGEEICDSRMHYGGPGYEEPMSAGAGHDHGGGAVHEHLSAVDQCVAPGIDRPVAVIERGQQLEIEAYYDDTLHPGMAHDALMGLAFFYVLEE